MVEDGAWLGRLQGELRSLLAPVFAQARSRLAAFAYLGALLAEPGDRRSCWQLAEAAGHATPRRMQALLAEHRGDLIARVGLGARDGEFGRRIGLVVGECAGAIEPLPGGNDVQYCARPRPPRAGRQPTGLAGSASYCGRRGQTGYWERPHS
jgi:hypothetical protein